MHNRSVQIYLTPHHFLVSLLKFISLFFQYLACFSQLLFSHFVLTSFQIALIPHSFFVSKLTCNYLFLQYLSRFPYLFSCIRFQLFFLGRSNQSPLIPSCFALPTQLCACLSFFLFLSIRCFLVFSLPVLGSPN